MPGSVVKSYAEKSGKTVEAVEELWDQIKAYVNKKYPKLAKARKFAYITFVLGKKLGIKKSKKAKKVKESNEILRLGELLVEATDMTVKAGKTITDVMSVYDDEEKCHEVKITGTIEFEKQTHDHPGIPLDIIDITATIDGKEYKLSTKETEEAWEILMDKACDDFDEDHPDVDDIDFKDK